MKTISNKHYRNTELRYVLKPLLLLLGLCHLQDNNVSVLFTHSKFFSFKGVITDFKTKMTLSLKNSLHKLLFL